ncbi:MAG: 3-keto-disaccharide hydrolase [Rubripirellula sp.]
MLLSKLRTTTFSISVLFLALANSNGNEWQNLIQGDKLDQWVKVGGDASYTLENGIITGKTGPGKNTFLTRGPFSDFELEFEVRCDAELNSGVQIRSHQYSEPTPQESKPNRIREKGEIYGYQCEITSKTNGSNGCAGNFWDEGRRTRWLDETVEAQVKQALYKAGEWNRYRIVAKGNHIQSYVNGELVADFRDDRDSTGLIGLQVHAIKKGTGPFEVSWKNIRIRELTTTR